MNNKWCISIMLQYDSKQVVIDEFERFVKELKDSNYAKRQSYGRAGNHVAVTGPSVEELSDEEIIALRKLVS